jgi:2-oxoglutarate dehydrogenase E1 component
VVLLLVVMARCCVLRCTCRDRTPDTPHPFLDDPSSAPLGWGLNTGHYDVRLTGQDCERGTFGQRHAVLWDQATGGRDRQLAQAQQAGPRRSSLLSRALLKQAGLGLNVRLLAATPQRL